MWPSEPTVLSLRPTEELLLRDGPPQTDALAAACGVRMGTRRQKAEKPGPLSTGTVAFPS